MSSEQTHSCPISVATPLQHPYDECEVTAVNVAGGSESYLKWVVDSTDSGARSGPAS